MKLEINNNSHNNHTNKLIMAARFRVASIILDFWDSIFVYYPSTFCHSLSVSSMIMTEVMIRLL